MKNEVKFMTIDTLKLQILSFLIKRSKETKLSEVIENFPEQRDSVLLSVLSMVRDGLLESIGEVETGEIENIIVTPKIKDIKTIQAKLAEIKETKDLKEIIVKKEIVKKSLGSSPVVTLPDELMAKVMSRGITVESTVECFSDLFSKATREVLLSVPFFEDEAVTVFHSELKRLAQKGIKIKVLVREFFEPNSSQSMERLVKGLRRLYDIYRSWGEVSKLEMRDYHRVLKFQPDEKPKHYESTHGKLLIVDREWAYVGSAEMRKNALFHNFETGLKIKGELVKIFAEIFLHVWEISKPIEFRYLENIGEVK
jgi:HKD family nuclease